MFKVIFMYFEWFKEIIKVVKEINQWVSVDF